MRETRELMVGGAAALLARFAFDGLRGHVEQTIVHVAPPHPEEPRLAALFIFTSSEDGALRDVFEAVLQSVQFYGDVPTPTRSDVRALVEPLLTHGPIPGVRARRR